MAIKEGTKALSSLVDQGKAKIAGVGVFGNLAKKGLDMAKKEGMKQLKKQGPALLDKAQDMAIKEGTKALSRLADQGKAKIAGAGRRKTKKEMVIDLIEDIAENPPKREGESRVRRAIDIVESMEGGSFWGKKGHFLGKHSGARKLATALKPIGSVALDMAADYAGPEAAPMREAIRQTTGAGLWLNSTGRGLTMSSRGAGLYMGVRGGAIGARKGVLSVGNGGSFLCERNPALQSQPYSANFFFNNQFPPSMQEQGIFGPYSGR